MVVALVTVAFAWMLRGFLLPVFWAVVLSVMFTPLFERLRRALRGRASLASLLTLVVVLVMVVAPIVGLGLAVTQEAVGVYGKVASGEIDVTAPVETVQRWLPRLSRQADAYNIDLDRVGESLSQAALAASRTVASRLLGIGQEALHALLMLVVAFYVLFFFLRDGERLREALVRAMPLGDPRERLLFERFANVTRATVKGTFVVAVVQGAIGGIAFTALGIGAPVLWGVLMGLFSLIPAIGSVIVWGPAAIYLFATGHVLQGAILVGVGAVLIGLADNALRPILVGREAGMPDYLILLSTLGGLAAFGVSGLVIGPVVAGLFLTVWDIFADEFGPLDTAKAPSDVLKNDILAVAVPRPDAGDPPAAGDGTSADTVVPHPPADALPGAEEADPLQEKP